jgi:tartrate-resistant acid phosphatase type 5
MRPLVLPALLVAACGGSPSSSGSPDAPGPIDAPRPVDAGPDAPPPTVRFAVLGDTGEGNTAQYDVGRAIKTICDRAGGCDFALLLGDNIYDDGVTSTTDSQWQTKFEMPYAPLTMPIYAVLGNHDYGGQVLLIDAPGVGNEWAKGPIEVMYTDVSDKWEMPATHYTIKHGNVGIIALDTNSILWDNTMFGDQRAWYPTALMELDGVDWKIAAGHHPYRSNGQHGNAGNYDAPELLGIPVPNPLPIVGGGDLKDFFDDVVCGTVDLVVSGHDHNRQWLDEPTALCGAELIISGAGAKNTGFQDRGNAFHYQDDQKPGFLLVEVTGKRLTGRFYDRTGALDFERTITKP